MNGIQTKHNRTRHKLHYIYWITRQICFSVWFALKIICARTIQMLLGFSIYIYIVNICVEVSRQKICYTLRRNFISNSSAHLIKYWRYWFFFFNWKYKVHNEFVEPLLRCIYAQNCHICFYLFHIRMISFQLHLYLSYRVVDMLFIPFYSAIFSFQNLCKCRKAITSGNNCIWWCASTFTKHIRVSLPHSIYVYIYQICISFIYILYKTFNPLNSLSMYVCEGVFTKRFSLALELCVQLHFMHSAYTCVCTFCVKSAACASAHIQYSYFLSHFYTYYFACTKTLCKHI